MKFNDLSAREKALITDKELKRRKELRKKGKQEALDHLYENTYRIKKAISGIKRRRIQW